ncbi:chromate transporter, partial [Ensifer sp. LC14]|uniref:chromate transporter n=1 Tax=Ensifer sp. LC14 TaxID=1873714 RepID=UPI0011124546
FLLAPSALTSRAAGVPVMAGARWGPRFFRYGGGHKGGAGPVLKADDAALGEAIPAHARPNLAWSLRISVVLLALWLVPLALLIIFLGPNNVFSQIALFFSQMAVVTFGGAYAVLAYVAQEAVQHYGWLKPGEMLDGLGMAETTPGPLIMVVQFVGFMGAYRDPGTISPMMAATLGAMLTTWVTFVPCFLWIFLGAPFIERLRNNVALTGAMSAITAAVVGVILNLAVWFGLHTLFGEVGTWKLGPFVLDIPVLRSLLLPSLLLTVAAGVAIFRFRTSVIATLLGCALAGMAWTLATT